VDTAADGAVKPVTFSLIGPVALYSARDGSSAGLAEQRLGSLEPNMVALELPEQAAEVRAIVATGSGRMPLDPSLGNALKVAETKDTWLQHIRKGGPVMIPILAMALAALGVALIKWVQISRVPLPARRKLEPLLEAVRLGDLEAAERHAGELRGPTGEMLSAGVRHIGEPKDLVEEIMFEKMLETRLRLTTWLPFIALSASSAPLLGLLGTVTGMINTFNLITVYGSGDARTLSSGISEALITTEYGLIVAIPALLLHAWLARRARRLVDGMEKSAVSLLNRLHGPGAEGRRVEPGLGRDDESTRERPLARPAVAAGAAYAGPTPAIDN
jgi:biopolymer transport protein ExbB